MKKLKIIKIDSYNYYFKDENNKKYNLNIEFYDIENKPIIGDIIYINEILLKDRVLSFGPLNGKYGKKIEKSVDKDILVLEKNNELIYLKRYYG